MVDMEVGEEHGIDPSEVDLGLAEPHECPWSNVDEQHAERPSMRMR